jgi:hypothetical protein
VVRGRLDGRKTTCMIVGVWTLACNSPTCSLGGAPAVELVELLYTYEGTFTSLD